MAEQVVGKWSGKARLEIEGLKAEQIWPFLSDFFNFHNWNPTIDSCYLKEGTAGEVGAIRRCISKAFPPADGNPEGTAWLDEKLVEFDNLRHTLSYEVIGNNVGLAGYFGTLKVSDTNAGCEIEWSFVADPVEGWQSEGFVLFMESTLPVMAEKMEAAAKAATP